MNAEHHEPITGPAAASFSDGARLLDSNEAAALIGRKPGALRWLVHQGKAPRSAMVGGKRMYWEHDVRAWVDAQFAAEDDHPAAA